MKHRPSPRAAFVISMLLACFALLPRAQAVYEDGCNNGLFNTWQGDDALTHDITGTGNTAFGWRALFTNADASFNTGVGAGALVRNNGTSNTEVGAAAMLLNVSGTENTAIGTDSLVFNATGSFNTAIGSSALLSNTQGFGNTAVGEGVGNTAIGDHAGSALTTGDFNVCIGVNVDGVAGESNTTHIRNIGSTPIVGGTNVVIDGIGGQGDQRLGYASPSRRYKADIQSMDKESETLFELKPVTFRAKGNMHSGNVKHYGLIAEDIEEVDSDLVVYDPEGNPETLRFDSINAMLLNEFLKEHRAFVEQQRKAEKLEAIVAGLVTTVKEQAAEIQKVSEQVAMNKSSTRTVAIDQ